jgi:hypothetical protein
VDKPNVQEEIAIGSKGDAEDGMSENVEYPATWSTDEVDEGSAEEEEEEMIIGTRVATPFLSVTENTSAPQVGEA